MEPIEIVLPVASPEAYLRLAAWAETGATPSEVGGGAEFGGGGLAPEVARQAAAAADRGAARVAPVVRAGGDAWSTALRHLRSGRAPLDIALLRMRVAASVAGHVGEVRARERREQANARRRAIRAAARSTVVAAADGRGSDACRTRRTAVS